MIDSTVFEEQRKVDATAKLPEKLKDKLTNLAESKGMDEEVRKKMIEKIKLAKEKVAVASDEL